MEWIAWAPFSVFVATSLALAALLAVWMGQWALGTDWSRTSGSLWLGSLLLGWGGVIVAVRLFRWLQPGPGLGFALGLLFVLFFGWTIALNLDWLGKLLASAMDMLVIVILAGMAFWPVILPFLLNARSFYRRKRLVAGFGRWLLAVTLVGLVLIPAVTSFVVGPKTGVFRVFYAVRESSIRSK
jgi:hypothetical protein